MAEIGNRSAGQGWPWYEPADWDKPPCEVGGFRFARLGDGRDAVGRIFFSPQRGRISDMGERARVLRYLMHCPTVGVGSEYMRDNLDPERCDDIRTVFRTDGRWVWTSAVEYYLREHGIAPEAELLNRIKAAHYRHPGVRPRRLVDARRATNEWTARCEVGDDDLRIYYAMCAQHVAVPARLRPRLMEIGWRPERDISARVQHFLGEWAAEFARLGYQPFDDASTIMAEFGGLGIPAPGVPVTDNQIPFVIYPHPGRDNFLRHLPQVRALGERLGIRLFQVGEVWDGKGALVIDEGGRVFAAGPQPRYLGATIYEAIEYMLEGTRPEGDPLL